MGNSPESEVTRLRGELRAARLQLVDLEHRSEELERRVAAEQASAAHFAQQVKDLRTSRSWQLTAPLRLVMRKGRS